MPWEATVPFPAENMNRCRGCGAPIGWVRWTDSEGYEHPKPVDPKGWHGESCNESAPGAKRGYTSDGERAACRPFPEGLLFKPDGVTVFTSHFVTCPKASDFHQKKAAPKA